MGTTGDFQRGQTKDKDERVGLERNELVIRGVDMGMDGWGRGQVRRDRTMSCWSQRQATHP